MGKAVKTIGLDTAKHVFQVHGADASGRRVLTKRLRRNQVSDFFANLPKCLVGLEATRGANYWARVIGSFGHEVRMMAPQFVRPFIKARRTMWRMQQGFVRRCSALMRLARVSGPFRRFNLAHPKLLILG